MRHVKAQLQVRRNHHGLVGDQPRTKGIVLVDVRGCLAECVDWARLSIDFYRTGDATVPEIAEDLFQRDVSCYFYRNKYSYTYPARQLSRVLLPAPEGPIMAVNLPPSNSPFIPLSSSFFSAGRGREYFRINSEVNEIINLQITVETNLLTIYSVGVNKIWFNIFLTQKWKNLLRDRSNQSVWKMQFTTQRIASVKSINLVIKRSIWIIWTLICKWICLIDCHILQIMIDGQFHTLFLYSQDILQDTVAPLDCHHPTMTYR